MNGSIPIYPTDQTGRIVLNSVGGVDYASSILMNANGCPDNFTGPQSPNRILYFPVFQRSPNLQKYIAEITRYRSRHQLEQPLYSGFDRSLSETDPEKALREMTIQEPSPINPPLAELQSILLELRSDTEDPHDLQFKGKQGLVNLRAILRAMAVYEGVFQPRPVSNEN